MPTIGFLSISSRSHRTFAQFRARLHRWMETAQRILQAAKSEEEALESFMATMRDEIAEHLPAEEVEHYVFNAGLNLSFLGLARYARKRAQLSGKL